MNDLLESMYNLLQQSKSDNHILTNSQNIEPDQQLFSQKKINDLLLFEARLTLVTRAG